MKSVPSLLYPDMILRIAIIALWVFFLSTCSSPEKNKTVAIGVTNSLLNSLVLIAQEKGYFREQGLDVQLKTYPSGKRALFGMQAGEVNVATTAEIPFMVYLSQSPDLRLITTLGSSDDELKIVARTDRGIETPEDLKGRIIATQKSSAVHFFLHLFLLQHYISEQDVSIVFKLAEQLPKALADGEIDAFSMREPFISQANRLLSGNIKVFSEPALYRKTYNLISSDSYVKHNPDVIKKLLRSILAAEQFARENPDQAILIMAKLLNTDIEAVTQLWANFVLRIVLDQDLLIQLQQQDDWTRRFSMPDSAHTQQATQLLNRSIHTDSLLQVAPERVGIKSVYH